MTVWNTIANMWTLDVSLSSFFETLESEIASQDCWRYNASEEIAALRTPNQWCWYASYWRYSLRRIQGSERGVPGHLTVGVELWRETAEQECLWVHARQPLIYVGFSPGNDWWSDDMAVNCLGSPLSYADGQVEPPTENAPYLWTWAGEDEERWNRRNWFFVLLLCSIEHKEDIVNNIVAPLRSLLVTNSDRDAAFGGTQAINTVLVGDPPNYCRRSPQ